MEGDVRSRYPELMRLAFLIVLMSVQVLPAAAGERDALFGTWGTQRQCDRVPIKPGGTVRAEPFAIGDKWLRQGQLWCRLDWGPVEARPDGLFAAAFAHCGEDGVRRYFLGLVLAGKDLTLRWDFPISNGPLQRCPAR